ncbi:hypothetical protein BBK36DRAFT_1191455 [Trichoderma citrinoviride]|uniref:Uncharacterized protein n=1 Tax=Trichoderma citrinoviride TaxID=58853 RepID=A0A2T4BHE0_9HYPO|nr:hypothetical protein BBK36DRAFT_1191455 [Trichoderma citrinoviride]PTB68659.1 hypothetical protein BBK36DRAFT_1191455 [Trichoderma citrinoviride]
MASAPFDPLQFGADFYNLYQGTAAIAPTAPPQLPSGGCNFVDLTPGAGGPRCGCRRFYSQPAVDQAGGWCMCNHHACYHDEHPQHQQQPPETILAPTAAAQALERLQTMRLRQTMSPEPDLLLRQRETPFSGPDFLHSKDADPLSFLNKPFDGPFDPLSAAPTPRQASSSMPDTLAWDGVVRPSQPDSNPSWPSIPPQCLMSQGASTTTNSSTRARYLRPFAGKGLQTLGNNGPANAQAALRESLSDHKMASIEEPDEESTPRPSTATTQIAEEPEALPHEMLKNLTETVDAHAERLDRLETTSVSGSAYEECQDRYEHMDARVIELEGKVDDIERRILDDSFLGRHDAQDDVATPSAASITSSTASRQSHSDQVHVQLRSLQTQVNVLRSAIPCHEHAWEVEVVFLPFPLKRIWRQIHQFNIGPIVDSGSDSSQSPKTQSASKYRDASGMLENWRVAQGQDWEWLLPRACNDQSIIYRRLRSRGLIKKIRVTGPDARSVSTAMRGAFGNVLRDMHMYARRQTPGLSSAPEAMGLQSPWIPLRKIHKDSRLRFLSPEEMLTPALWDVQFLNSVRMEAAQPRLFVTHPGAYLQDSKAYDSGWTWQKLKKEVPSVYADDTESQEVPDSARLERECWAWNDNLDGDPIAQPPGKNRRHRSVSISPQVEYHSASPSWSSSFTDAAHHQPTILKSREESVPPFIRTPSAPTTSMALQTVFSAPRKRKTSSSRRQSRQSSPLVYGGVRKRQSTREPSFHQPLSPRPTVSPSPAPDRPERRDRTIPRGTTPATPHSMFAPRGFLTERVDADMDEGEETDVEMGLYNYNLQSDGEGDHEGAMSSTSSPEPAAQGPIPLDPHGHDWGREDDLSDAENIDPMAEDDDGDTFDIHQDGEGTR